MAPCCHLVVRRRKCNGFKRLIHDEDEDNSYWMWSLHQGTVLMLYRDYFA